MAKGLLCLVMEVQTSFLNFRTLSLIPGVGCSGCSEGRAAFLKPPQRGESCWFFQLAVLRLDGHPDRFNTLSQGVSEVRILLFKYISILTRPQHTEQQRSQGPINHCQQCSEISWGVLMGVRSQQKSSYIWERKTWLPGSFLSVYVKW